MTYLLMALLGLLAFAMVLSRTDYKAELLAVSLVAASLIALADWLVFGTFRLYTYHPHLLPGRTPDETLGEFLAELLFVPALVGALVGSFPGTVPTLAGTLLLTGIEFAFERSGIFAHTGWRLWYSTAAFAWPPTAFWMSSEQRCSYEKDRVTATRSLRYMAM